MTPITKSQLKTAHDDFPSLRMNFSFRFIPNQSEVRVVPLS